MVGKVRFEARIQELVENQPYDVTTNVCVWPIPSFHRCQWPRRYQSIADINVGPYASLNEPANLKVS
jgi:hypothetical protein